MTLTKNDVGLVLHSPLEESIDRQRRLFFISGWLRSWFRCLRLWHGFASTFTSNVAIALSNATMLLSERSITSSSVTMLLSERSIASSNATMWLCMIAIALSNVTMLLSERSIALSNVTMLLCMIEIVLCNVALFLRNGRLLLCKGGISLCAIEIVLHLWSLVNYRATPTTSILSGAELGSDRRVAWAIAIAKTNALSRNAVAPRFSFVKGDRAASVGFCYTWWFTGKGLTVFKPNYGRAAIAGYCNSSLNESYSGYCYHNDYFVPCTRIAKPNRGFSSEAGRTLILGRVARGFP